MKSHRKTEIQAIKKMASEMGMELTGVHRCDYASALFRQIWIGEGCEKINASLVAELAGEGWKSDELKLFIDENFEYCRPRKSFVKSDLPEGICFEINKTQVHVHTMTPVMV